MADPAAYDEAAGGTSPSPQFWETVRRAPRRLLMVDYDGTLVPYRLDWTTATPGAHARELLQRLAHRPGMSLVIFSGRRVAELQWLIGPVPVHLVGEHGWEERTADGKQTVRPVPGETAKWLGWAARAARDHGWERDLERKRCSLVLHTRRYSPDEALRIEEACERAWTPACRQDGLRLNRVNGGLELRAFVRHEGAVVSDLIARSEPGTLPVYLGDDLSDEDAFFQVIGRGVGIHVGAWVSESIADYSLPAIDDVLEFLELWDRTIVA